MFIRLRFNEPPTFSKFKSFVISFASIMNSQQEPAKKHMVAVADMINGAYNAVSESSAIKYPNGVLQLNGSLPKDKKHFLKTKYEKNQED